MDTGRGDICECQKQGKLEPIRGIVFRRVANPFLNAGIIGLHRVAERFLQQERGRFPGTSISDLVENCLQITAETETQLLDFLEEVYYYMGREYYDTATTKQKENNDNVYFEEKNGTLIPHRFPKMNTYGLTHLFTNNAQGITREGENSWKFATLKKENPKYAELIESYFEKEGLKLLQKVYLNEPYTKLTRLDVDPKFLREGDKVCPIIGERFLSLVEAKNISPFLSGLANFNSFLSSSEKKVSWKALYLIRFAPVVCFYSYHNSYETLICHLFKSDSLENLDLFYRRDMYLLKDELAQSSFRNNIRLAPFKYPRKDREDLILDPVGDAVWPSELSFLLIYSFFQLHFKPRMEDDELDFNFYGGFVLPKQAITLVTFKADKFASTLRPNYYEECNRVKFVLSILAMLEKGDETSARVSIKELWSSLRLSSSKIQTAKKKK